MTSVFDEREEQAIHAIAARYRSRGYHVVVRPGPELLPDALNGTQPDLFASNANENVIIEVKSKASLGKSTAPKRIAQSLANLPGWRFELVITNPELLSSVPLDGEALSQREIRAQLDEARALSARGHVSAALLVAWSAIEALLRRIASKNGLDTTGYSPSELYKELYSIGLIPRKAYEIFADAVRSRNSLAHGFRVSAGTLRSTLDCSVTAAERLLKELQSSRLLTPRASGHRGRRRAAE